jgi:hypothetical protein
MLQIKKGRLSRRAFKAQEARPRSFVIARLTELFHGGRKRLGEGVLAAQADCAETRAFPTQPVTGLERFTCIEMSKISEISATRATRLGGSLRALPLPLLHRYRGLGSS